MISDGVLPLRVFEVRYLDMTKAVRGGGREA